MKALEDLKQTATLYGDHAFLMFVLTDGRENASRQWGISALQSRLNTLPDNWTVACLVPNQRGVFEAKSFGFPPDNVEVWDTTSAAGVTEVGETIRRATDNFMQARATGNFRGTRSLFSTGLDNINAATVHSTLKPLDLSAYDVFPVHHDSPIREYAYSRGVPYQVGKGFYQLTKTETIQPQKQIAIREKTYRAGLLGQRGT
jgi:hypothetical protein